ncbi:hypothetical protein FCM35_KLT02635 [Carex littledalei]|uniref:Uncharacterized protein n=1 Tax=Carex littledalei TaxID=544730 RepID=A0A833VS80_9POAL|nr:hypothetical protein FCM35_KLT02635 [Carex littledalei]
MDMLHFISMNAAAASSVGSVRLCGWMERLIRQQTLQGVICGQTLSNTSKSWSISLIKAWRKPVYARRNEVIGSIQEFWLVTVDRLAPHARQLHCIDPLVLKNSDNQAW